MTETSEAAKAKAWEIMARGGRRGRNRLATFIQQVSDAAKGAADIGGRNGATNIRKQLAPFILPEPVDPLVEILNTCAFDGRAEGGAAIIRAELAKRGYKIVKDET